MIAFAVAAALCALGGALLAPTVPVVYNSDLAITINGFAAAVFGGLASIRLALLGGYALGILEQLVVGYVDPQYNLIIALVAMLVLIGWRSRGETGGMTHRRGDQGAPCAAWPARRGWRCSSPPPSSPAGSRSSFRTFDVGLYDRMGLYALVALGLTLLMGFAGQVSLGQGAFFLIGAYTSGLLTVGLDPDKRLVDLNAGIDPLVAVAVAPIVTAVVAAVIGVPLLRLRGHYLAFATLAFHLIMPVAPLRPGPIHGRTVRRHGHEAARRSAAMRSAAQHMLPWSGVSSR